MEHTYTNLLLPLTPYTATNNTKTKTMENDTSTKQNCSLCKGVVLPSLLAAGKLALAARLVTTANAKNLSQRIEQMEAALDAYDNEILSLSNED